MRINQSQPSFTARWCDIRKVIEKLPEKHEVFASEVIFSKSYQKKDVFLKEYDEGAEAIKKIYPEYEHYLAKAPLRERLPVYWNRFKALLNGQRDPDKEREKLVESKGFHKAIEDPKYWELFEESMKDIDHNYLNLLSNGASCRFVNRMNEMNGDSPVLFRVLKKAGLKDPHKITFN